MDILTFDVHTISNFLPGYQNGKSQQNDVHTVSSSIWQPKIQRTSQKRKKEL